MKIPRIDKAGPIFILQHPSQRRACRLRDVDDENPLGPPDRGNPILNAAESPSDPALQP
jgi:hypothetical protein